MYLPTPTLQLKEGKLSIMVGGVLHVFCWWATSGTEGIFTGFVPRVFGGRLQPSWPWRINYELVGHETLCETFVINDFRVSL